MNYKTFLSLLNKGLDSNSITVLEFFRDNIEIESNPKIDAIIAALFRKGFITNDGKLTNQGIELLESVNNQEDIKVITRQKKQEDFDKFMAYFPASDGFNYKGNNFPRTRAVKKNNEKVKELFAKAILTTSVDKLINAVVAEVYAKVNDSIKVRQNKMQFFVNTETYLKNNLYDEWKDEEVSKEDFDGYFDLFARKPKISEYNGVNI